MSRLIVTARGRASRHPFIISAETLLLFYVHLWIVEGAVRKWMPQFDDAMYVGRDLYLILVIGILATSIPARRTPTMLFVLIVTIVGYCLTAAIINSTALMVTAIGIRSYVSPLLFTLATLMFVRHASEFIRRSFRIMCYYVPLQAAITIIQVTSAPISLINREVGGEAAHFVNTDIVRASGTFSSPSGLTSYVVLAMVACLCLFYGTRGKLSIWYGLLTLLTILISLLSGSRGTVLLVSNVLIALIAWSIASANYVAIRATFYTLLTGTLTIMLVVSLFPAVLESFVNRFIEANEVEDTTSRIEYQSIGFISALDGFVGNGPGAHTQAGIASGSPYEWVEMDTIKWVAELGMFGFLLSMLRVGAGILIFTQITLGIRRVSIAEVLIGIALAPILISGIITQTPSHQAAFSICLSLYLLSTARVPSHNQQISSIHSKVAV